MVQGGMSCIKYLMFVFNFVFVVCGIALVCVGGIAYSTKDYTVFLDSKYVSAPMILIVIGCIIFFLAFLGCCGAVRENHCMVMTFGFLLFLIFIIEIAGGIAAYAYRSQFEGFLKENMNKTIHPADGTMKPDVQIIWDEMQSTYKCCGVDKFTDYPPLSIPGSCCGKSEKNSTCKPDEDKIYEDGCFVELLNKLKSISAKVGGTAIGIAVIELLGVIFAWCLASAIKKEYEGV